MFSHYFQQELEIDFAVSEPGLGRFRFYRGAELGLLNDPLSLALLFASVFVLGALISLISTFFAT